MYASFALLVYIISDILLCESQPNMANNWFAIPENCQTIALEILGNTYPRIANSQFIFGHQKNCTKMGRRAQTEPGLFDCIWWILIVLVTVFVQIVAQ